MDFPTGEAKESRHPLLKKSRSGCRDCKLRRVKCDEVKPACSNCRKRYNNIESCDWAAGPRRSLVPRHTSHSPRIRKHTQRLAMPKSSVLSPVGMLRPHSVKDVDTWRSIELRLMHHYTAVVSRSMPDCNGAPGQDMWERTIPQLAFESEVVVNPMLAISALHLHAHAPQEAAMGTVARRYLDRTLIDHQQALSSSKPLTEQIWLSAVLLSNIYWLLSRQTVNSESYELPFAAWRVMRGTRLIFTNHHHFLCQLGYDWFEADPEIWMPRDGDLPKDAQKFLHGLADDMTHLFNTFEVATLPREVRDTYAEARDYILQYYRVYFSGAEAKLMRRFIGTMVMDCRPEYLRLLQEHDPLAMALLARMMVMMKGLDYAWWMNGKGEYEVMDRDIKGIYDLIPTEFQWAMEWPLGVLSGDIALDRNC
ncbi:hypothetical protein BX600DRAFT_67989 [Xylariales sp. PMI_506]|nr:hypothetical protein BX600DRAFT_67989 [Xylariales sp. PMI_506]